MRRARLMPKGCGYFTDSRGKRRLRFRIAGKAPHYPKSAPGTPEFLAEYEAYMAAKPVMTTCKATVHGTISYLAARFYSSAEWHGLKPSTQSTYRGIIERFRRDHGDKRVASLDRTHVKSLLDQKAKTPAAANNWLRMLRSLLDYAIEIGLREDNPASLVKRVKTRSDGFRMWPKEYIAAFRGHHQLGTRARLAFELLYNTLQRRGDVVRMGRQHFEGDLLTIIQQKTGTPAYITQLPELRAALDLIPAQQLTFLLTQFGAPFTAAGFGNWFRDMCSEAGVPPGFSAHGLRKSGATRLAEAGATDHEIMAIGGWTTIKEVQRYTRLADRKHNAARGFAKLETRTKTG